MSDLLWLKKELKRSTYGLDVKAVAGWKTRGHPGSYDPIGVMIHHTASAAGSNAPALGTVTNGRPDLPGPLCQVLIARDATVYIIAAGYAYHAGEGGPFREIPANSGNRYMVGIECENNGVGEAWPKEQRKVMALVTAVILEHFDRGAGYCIGHREWTSRKIDPAGIAMDTFRENVRKELKALR